MKTKKIDEATLCLGDVLNSRAVVGLGERNLHLAPWAVILYANGATTEAFRESEVLWWILLMIRSPCNPQEIFFGEIIIQHFRLPEGFHNGPIRVHDHCPRGQVEITLA